MRILIGVPPAAGIPQQLFYAGDLPDQLAGRAALGDIRVEHRESSRLRIVRGCQDFVKPSRPLPILGREENPGVREERVVVGVIDVGMGVEHKRHISRRKAFRRERCCDGRGMLGQACVENRHIVAV